MNLLMSRLRIIYILVIKVKLITLRFLSFQIYCCLDKYQNSHSTKARREKTLHKRRIGMTNIDCG